MNNKLFYLKDKTNNEIFDISAVDLESAIKKASEFLNIPKQNIIERFRKEKTK